MKKIYYALITLFFFYQAAAQNARVGINTTTPLARLHVADSSVVFTQAALLPNTAVPVSGQGARMMWYPGRAAFRAGYVFGSEWNRDSIGNYSVAFGNGTVASGLSAVAMGYNAKARGNYSTAFGFNSVANFGSFAVSNSKALGDNSCAIGDGATALGDYSFAWGLNSSATGNNSIAMGDGSVSSGFEAVAVGEGQISSGDNAFSTGYVNKASGDCASAFGRHLIAKSYSAFYIGQYNDTTSGISNSWNSLDPLFVIGNGLSGSSRSNAFTVLKNGFTGIGTASPERMLHVKVGESGGVVNASAAVIIESDANCHIQLSTPSNAEVGILSGNTQTAIRSAIIFRTDSSLQLRSGGSNTRIHIDKSGNIGIGTTTPSEKLHVVGNGKFTGTVTASCGVLSCSDMRYKKDITPISQPLQSILSLRGFYYYWDDEKFKDKGFDQARQIGISAQELEVVFPELVKTEADGYKLVDYSRLTPVLIEAIKEQQSIIQDLKAGLADQQSQIDELKQLVMSRSNPQVFSK